MQAGTSPSATSKSPAARWLLEHGPRELELLFRAIVYHRAAPVLLTDDDGTYCEASAGAGKLLGLSRENIIGRRMDDFTAPGFKPEVAEIWRDFVRNGEKGGTLRLSGPDGQARAVEYKAKFSVMPVRHVVALRDKPVRARSNTAGRDPVEIPSLTQDYALSLLDESGEIVAWYSGAARIYRHTETEAVGQNAALLYAPLYSKESPPNPRLQEELRRADASGHFGNEGWQFRKDGARFWANVMTMALRDDQGKLQGFARVVRDFSERHGADERLQHSHERIWPAPAESTIAGIISGEFDRISEVNDAFLELVGYSREDFNAGRMRWPDLTPSEYLSPDELAHEEALRFGACAPYEKDLIRKDKTRVAVVVATAVLNLSPFRWISFVQDANERGKLENVGDPEHVPKKDFSEMVGSSADLKRVQRLIEVVSPTDATVLVCGETGTGKELVARAIHTISARRKLPFITLNCAAIPTGLLESELFGYERGAFTGALSQKIGRFEMANKGTLFLDEVGDIPLDIQPKLLRALQEKSFERLGGTKTIPIDVRLVAATNRNLTQMMGDKLFRSDLYYRLRVFPITTSPLRDHPADIPLLARHFVRKYATRMGRHIDKIPAETMRALVSWKWPGNVRELENFIERSVILSRGSTLRAPLAEIRAEAAPVPASATLQQVEREYIMRVLRESGGVVTTAAVRLGLQRTTLNAMMRKLGIYRNDL